MLKIKEGSEIYAYGPQAEPFTEKTELSQEQLEHLKTRFPEDIVDEEEQKKSLKTKNK